VKKPIFSFIPLMLFSIENICEPLFVMNAVAGKNWKIRTAAKGSRPDLCFVY
jgi:hypothetical protein